MASVINWYHDLMDNRSDPRVNGWAMMSSPLPTVAACVCYAYVAKSLGPRLMESRKPFQLRSILIWYNLFQTLFSAWIFYEYLASGWFGHYNFTCQLVDYSRSPLAMRMAHTCWWYYFSKFTEFFDTLFFILRKKTEHVSTLHVIHHGIMPFSVWMGLKFAPGGHSTFFALLNTFVHIIMYMYYMVAAMGPRYQKYIWWKKYLTAIQMVQFVAIFTHQLQVFFRPSCEYPRGFVLWIAMHGFLFLFLFSDFYKAKYSGARKSGAKKEEKNGVISNGHASGASNTGLCMPVLEDEKLLNGRNGYANGASNGHCHVPASYASGDADAYVRRRDLAS